MTVVLKKSERLRQQASDEQDDFLLRQNQRLLVENLRLQLEHRELRRGINLALGLIAAEEPNAAYEQLLAALTTARAK